MEKKKIELNAPVAISGITIVPVTETSMQVRQKDGKASYFGFKRPVYVLVLSPEAPARAFQVTGEETTVELIASEYPELKDALEKLKKFEK
jgi:hypothetical protein